MVSTTVVRISLILVLHFFYLMEPNTATVAGLNDRSDQDDDGLFSSQGGLRKLQASHSPRFLFRSDSEETVKTDHLSDPESCLDDPESQISDEPELWCYIRLNAKLERFEDEYELSDVHNHLVTILEVKPEDIHKLTLNEHSWVIVVFKFLRDQSKLRSDMESLGLKIRDQHPEFERIFKYKVLGEYLIIKTCSDTIDTFGDKSSIWDDNSIGGASGSSSEDLFIIIGLLVLVMTISVVLVYKCGKRRRLSQVMATDCDEVVAASPKKYPKKTPSRESLPSALFSTEESQLWSTGRGLEAQMKRRNPELTPSATDTDTKVSTPSASKKFVRSRTFSSADVYRADID